MGRRGRKGRGGEMKRREGEAEGWRSDTPLQSFSNPSFLYRALN